MVQFQGYRRSIKPGVAMIALVHAAVCFLNAASQRGFVLSLPQDLVRLASVGAHGACDISEESLLAIVCEAATSEPLGIETDVAFFRVVNAYPERRDKLVADHQCAARSLVHVCLCESLGMVGGEAHQLRASTSDFVALDLQRWCSISILPRVYQALCIWTHEEVRPQVEIMPERLHRPLMPLNAPDFEEESDEEGSTALAFVPAEEQTAAARIAEHMIAGGFLTDSGMSTSLVNDPRGLCGSHRDVGVLGRPRALCRRVRGGFLELGLGSSPLQHHHTREGAGTRSG